MEPVEQNQHELTRLGQLLVGLIAILIVLGLWFVARQIMVTAPESKRQTKQPLPRMVSVETLQSQNHPIQISGWGEVLPAQSLILRAQVAAEIQHMPLALLPGDVVTAGTVLFELDDRLLQHTLQQRQAALQKAQAELALEQGNQAMARTEYQMSGRTLSKEKQQWVLRQPQLNIAKAQVAEAQAALKAAQLQLSWSKIRAPFDAVVTQRWVEKGTSVTTSTDLLELVSTEQYWIQVALPPYALQWLPTATAPDAAVIADVAYPGLWGQQTRQGQLLQTKPQIQTTGRMAQVLVGVTDPLALKPEHADAPALLLGAYVQVNLQGAMLQHSFKLPRQWLRQQDNVWLYRDGQLQIQPVQVSYRDGDFVYVTAGLHDGDQLILSNLSVVSQGMPLRLERQVAESAVQQGGR